MQGAAEFFATVLIRVLEGLFAIGVVGSVLVIILSSIEDARTLTDKGEQTQVRTGNPRETASDPSR